MKKLAVVVLAILVLGVTTRTASAVGIGAGQYYTDVVGGGIGSAPSGYVRNDDGFFGPYNLGFTLNYFGINYTQFFLNNNGNITFGAGIGAFTPTSTLDSQTLAPMIAPYWADVDTRPLNGGTVTVRNDPDQLIATWDQVGYFGNHTDLLASFQLVVRGPGYSVPGDEGTIGFFYKTVGWETGDASGGSGGFNGTPASAGFGDGLSSSNTGEVSIAGSRQNGISRVVTNHHYWFNLGQGGIPVPQQPPVNNPVPEPASMVLLGTGLSTMIARRLRRR